MAVGGECDVDVPVVVVLSPAYNADLSDKNDALAGSSFAGTLFET
jgi:hypothetical protein